MEKWQAGPPSSREGKLWNTILRWERDSHIVTPRDCSFVSPVPWPISGPSQRFDYIKSKNVIHEGTPHGRAELANSENILMQNSIYFFAMKYICITPREMSDCPSDSIGRGIYMGVWREKSDVSCHDHFGGVAHHQSLTVTALGKPMAQESSLLSPLIIDSGSPPEQWVKDSYKVDVNARILSFWEASVSLIKNEGVLGQDQKRFLAMIHDHKVGPWSKSRWECG